MKKQLLSLGALAAVAAPVVAVVSCGQNAEVAKIKAEYTSKKMKDEMITILTNGKDTGFKLGADIEWSKLNELFGIGDEPAFKDALGSYTVKAVDTKEGTVTIEAEVKTKVADKLTPQKTLGKKTFVIKPAAKEEAKPAPPKTNNTGTGGSSTFGKTNNTGTGGSSTSGNTNNTGTGGSSTFGKTNNTGTGGSSTS